MRTVACRPQTTMSSKVATTLARPHSATYHSAKRFKDQDKEKLLAWFQLVREARSMPWRRPFDASLSKAELGQRAYEVRLTMHLWPIVLTTFACARSWSQSERDASHMPVPRAACLLTSMLAEQNHVPTDSGRDRHPLLQALAGEGPAVFVFGSATLADACSRNSILRSWISRKPPSRT